MVSFLSLAAIVLPLVPLVRGQGPNPCFQNCANTNSQQFACPGLDIACYCTLENGQFIDRLAECVRRDCPPDVVDFLSPYINKANCPGSSTLPNPSAITGTMTVSLITDDAPPPTGSGTSTGPRVTTIINNTTTIVSTIAGGIGGGNQTTVTTTVPTSTSLTTITDSTTTITSAVSTFFGTTTVTGSPNATETKGPEESDGAGSKPDMPYYIAAAAGFAAAMAAL